MAIEFTAMVHPDKNQNPDISEAQRRWLARGQRNHNRDARSVLKMLLLAILLMVGAVAVLPRKGLEVFAFFGIVIALVGIAACLVVWVFLKVIGSKR